MAIHARKRARKRRCKETKKTINTIYCREMPPPLPPGYSLAMGCAFIRPAKCVAD